MLKLISDKELQSQLNLNGKERLKCLIEIIKMLKKYMTYI